MDAPSDRPVWLDGEAAAHYPPLQQDLEVDVAVIGAGITGLTAALLLQRDGRSTAVLERNEVARGATAHTSGHLTAVLDAPFHVLVSHFGMDGARDVLAGCMAAIDKVGELAVECAGGAEFQRVPGFRYTEDAHDVDRLAKEADLAARLGLPASLVREPPLPFAVGPALRIEDQAVFQPLRYAAGLARAFVAAGGRIFEHAPVHDVEPGEPCKLSVDGVTVRARAVVEATHTPVNRVVSVQARLAPEMTYVVCARIAGVAPAALCWDTAEPYHYLRPLQPGGHHLVAGGFDHKTGQADDTSTRFRQLESWLRARFDVAAIERRWSAEVFEPADGLPYVGPLEGKPVYVAAGFAGTGLTLGTLAALIVRDEIEGRTHPLGELLRANRVKPIASAREVVKENANNTWHMLRDRLARPEAASAAVIAPGEGRLMEVEGHRAAVYRDPEGRLHVLSPVCTHLGCIVHWNSAGSTWDCACHGGRYRPTGQVLYGPPTRDLDGAD